MSTQKEEIVVRAGFDNTGLAAGLRESEGLVGSTVKTIGDAYKKLTMEYVGFWEGALAKKDRAEAISNDLSLARMRANLAEKAALNKAWMEEQAAQSVIAGGSGGYGSGFKTAEQIAAEGGESAVASGAAGQLAGAGLREAGKEAHGFAGILRETAVLFREGFRGNFTRMIGSASLLLGMMGTLAVSIALPLAAILAIPGWRTWQAHKAENESAKRLQEKVNFQAEIQRQHVKELYKHGMIGRSEEERLQQQLEHPDADALTSVRDSTRQYDQQLKSALELESKQKAIADYAARRAESEKIIAEQVEKQAEETAKMSHQYAGLRREGLAIRTAFNREDESLPTIEDLAGRSWTERLNRQYGKGGRFDLGRGNGIYSSAARESELSAKQMQYDLIYGNGSYQVGKDGIGYFTGAAEQDRQRKMRADNILGAAGLDTPTQKMEAMKQHLEQISDSMHELIRRADAEGIPVQIPSQ